MSGAGQWEIERRYLVRVSPDLWESLGPGADFVQGYVVTGDPSVRIRRGEARGAVLAVKGGSGIRRSEAETVVDAVMADALMAAAGNRVIRKTRWVLGSWELDRFEGALRGLTVLEIELADEDDPIPATPTGVTVMREVTEDNAFTSSALANLDSGAQERLVARLYGNQGGR